ncbi:MAG TPA: amidase [Hyphomicrobiaceae bacterium]|nr:amidase [Hyphomicrobiaceae bacterium]
MAGDRQHITSTGGEPTDLGLAGAAGEIAAGRLSSEDLVSACLKRISQRDPDIGAFAWADPAYAIEQARRADRWRLSGNGCGPLHGVPIAIKDVIDTADMPTENGSPVFSGRRPDADAFCVAALRSAGAIILGKTVSTELALMTPSTTNNPQAPGHSPGGSSAGSAAAVASGMIPAALGTQTAGSVLRPASYCGIYGFKPTLGLISRRGVLMQSHTLDTVGVLTRSIEDAALLTDCLATHDPDDPASYPRSQPNLSGIAAQEPPATPLLAFVKTPAWQDAEPSLHDAYQELAATLGAGLEEIEAPVLADVIEWQRIVQLAENAAYYGPLLDHYADQLSPGLKERLRQGSDVPVRTYLEAIRAREAAYHTVAGLFDRYTAILTPASPGTAPALETGITGSPIFNGLWTYLGMPAISVPLLEVDGLPLGVQLVGARRDDGRLLRTARWLENHLGRETGGATA